VAADVSADGVETAKTFTGKITGVIFGCNGRMEGFVLSECCDRDIRFTACDRELEPTVLQACTGADGEFDDRG